MKNEAKKGKTHIKNATDMLYSKNCGFHTFRAFVHANFKSLEFDWATMIASAPGSMRTLMLPTTQPMQP